MMVNIAMGIQCVSRAGSHVMIVYIVVGIQCVPRVGSETTAGHGVLARGHGTDL